MAAETDVGKRLAILHNVLAFDQALAELEHSRGADWLNQAKQQDRERLEKLRQAKERFNSLEVAPEILGLCIKLSRQFQAEGNRGHYVLAMAARTSASPNFFAYDDAWVGQDNLVRDLSYRIGGNCRLLILVGIAGIGKTALGERLAVSVGF